ncbi:MAG: NAD(P)-dependent oxidoreductase [Patescibacteria group bacterium]
MKTRMLVTGASGFIGRNLFEYFSQKEEVEVFGTYRTRSFPTLGHLYYGNLVREDVVRMLLKEVKPQVLIHAAAATAGFQDFKQKETAFIHDNIIMNTHVIALAAEYGVEHVVLLSCSLVYPSMDVCVAECDDALKPVEHPYAGGAKVKRIMEDLAWQYAHLSGGRTVYTMVRHSNIYGPYDKFKGGGHLIAGKIAEVANAKIGDTVSVRGPGTELRDVLHIDDLLHFVDIALLKDMLRTYVWNVGYGRSFSVNDIVRMIISLSGKQLIICNDTSVSGAPTQPALNCTKAKQKLGWEPKVSILQGLGMTMDWYKANKHIL